MKDSFVGRKDELDTLKALRKKKSASLVVIRGRRRIGKSRLIQEFAKGERFLSFSGMPPTPEIDAGIQRATFATQMGFPGIASDDWSALFTLLAKQTASGRVVIAFDEISWMGSKDPTFLGKLKNAWDLELKNNPELILILCGSVSTWIEENILSSTAFFGRISLNLKLEELSIASCAELLQTKGFHGSSHEVFQLLSVTGGIPWYLEQVQANTCAEETLRQLCFRKEGVLFNEFESIFHDLFEKRSAIYRPIVEALASGPLEFATLCKRCKMAKSGTVSGYLDDLIESGFVSRDFTWLPKSGKPSKLSQYRLSDNYLRFYLKTIAPNKDRIARGAFLNESISTMPGWNGIMALQFENLVLQNRQKIWEKMGIKPKDIVADNPYFQRKTSTKKGCQIDYLIQTRFGTLFACEIKFSLHPIQTDVIKEMKTKLDALSLPKRFSAWPILIHVNGISGALQDSGYFAEVIDFGEFL